MTKEELQDLLDEIEERLALVDVITVEEQKDLNAAKSKLETAIASTDALTDVKKSAQKALATIYNDMADNEQTLANADYLAAVANINNATSFDEVDEALVAGIKAVKAYDADENSDSDLAAEVVSGLFGADKTLDEVVAVLLKEESNTKTIADNIWNGTDVAANRGNGNVIPALVRNGIPVEKIFEDFLAGAADLDATMTDVVNSLQKESSLSNADIVDGYAVYVLTNKVGTIEGVTVTGSNGKYNITVSADDIADVEIKNTGVQKMLGALLDDGNVKYTTQQTAPTVGQLWDHTSGASVSNTVADVINMITNAINGQTWEMKITLGSDTITVVIAPEA